MCLFVKSAYVKNRLHGLVLARYYYCAHGKVRLNQSPPVLITLSQRNCMSTCGDPSQSTFYDNNPVAVQCLEKCFA